MKRILGFLDVKPVKEEITTDKIHQFVLKKEYKKNQEMIFWTTFLAYMTYYFTRKQWTIFGSQLMNDEIISETHYTTIGLVMAIVYGCCKFINSPLSDKKSNRWLLGLGLIGAAIFNLILGFFWIDFTSVTTPIVLSCILMIFIGWIHSLGAIPSTRLFYNWFNHKDRRTRNILWNPSHNIGSALAAFIITGSYALFSESLGRLAYFILPSIISFIVGFLVIILIRENPQSLGLPSVQKFYNIKLIGEQSGKNIDEDKPWKWYFINYLLKNKFIWLLVLATIMGYTLRMGMSDWMFRYFKKEYDFDVKNEAKWLASSMDFGALFAMLTIGFLINKYLKRFALPMVIIYLVATAGIILVWLSKTNSMAILALGMFISGLIFIPQCFLPIMAAEYAHHKVVSTAAGLLGIAAYFGDAFMSKVVIGYGLINVSWNAVFIFVTVCGIIGAIVLLPMLKKSAI